LASVGAALGLHSEEHHRALADADLARRVFLALLARLHDLDDGTLEALDRLPAPPDWTPAYLLRREAQARQRPGPAGGSFGGLALNLGDQLASKLGVHPSVLALAGAAAAHPTAAPVSTATLERPEAERPEAERVTADAAPDEARRAAVAARMAPVL